MWFAELFQDNKAHIKAIGNPQGPARRSRPQLLFAHPHYFPVRLGLSGCSFQFGRASALSVPRHSSI